MICGAVVSLKPAASRCRPILRKAHARALRDGSMGLFRCPKRSASICRDLAERNPDQLGFGRVSSTVGEEIHALTQVEN